MSDQRSAGVWRGSAARRVAASGVLTVLMLLTMVVGSGTAAPATRHESPRAVGETSYDIGLKVRYDGFFKCQQVGGGCWTFRGKFVESDSKCTKMHNWDFQNSDGYGSGLETKITIVTSGKCFFEPAVAKIRLEKEGGSIHPAATAYLTVTQIGPRLFVSTCTDAPYLTTSCRVLFAPVAPRVDLDVR